MKIDLVSVVIPTRNRFDLLIRCVDSVLASTWRNIEVIAVDDASTDDSCRRFNEHYANVSNVKMVRNKANSLAAHTRNHGVQYADGEFILFVDDDNEIEPDMIERLVDAFRKHPESGMIAPITAHWSDSSTRRYWTLGSVYHPWTSRFSELHGSFGLISDIPKDIDLFPTIGSPNCYMVSREAFDRVGGQDEGYGIMFEDPDFGMRLLEAGFKCYICPHAETHHFGHVDSGCDTELRNKSIGYPRRAYAFARNRMKFARRFSSFPQATFVAFCLSPLFAAYYCGIAIKHRRLDIAFAFLAGTLAGILGIYKAIYFHPPYPEP